jgi:hypothetical protein
MRAIVVASLILASTGLVTGRSSAAPAGRSQPRQTRCQRGRAAQGGRGRATPVRADTPLEFTLTADFRAVNRDRNPESTKVFPATMTVARADGTMATFPLNIRTRGHVRRMLQTCAFAPLRLEFQPEQVKKTVFEGLKNIKLGTHCRDVDLFEQYVPREYSAYRLFNLLTPNSFRARLAKATYVDQSSQKPIAVRQAIFIEDDDDVAKRMEGRNVAYQKLTFRRVDQETVTLMTLFEYMIGNTDWSMYLLHNVVLTEKTSGIIYPVPWTSTTQAWSTRATPSRRNSSTSRRFAIGFIWVRVARPPTSSHLRQVPGAQAADPGAVRFDSRDGRQLPQGLAEHGAIFPDDQPAERGQARVRGHLQQPRGLKRFTTEAREEHTERGSADASPAPAAGCEWESREDKMSDRRHLVLADSRSHLSRRSRLTRRTSLRTPRSLR